MAAGPAPGSRRRSARPTAARGVAMLEFALVATVLFSLFAAVADFGLAWRKSIEVAGTIRGGARVVSNLGNARAADLEALRTINAGLAEVGSANLVRVIVFRVDQPTNPDADVPPACLNAAVPTSATTTGSGVSGATNPCNVYGPAQLAAIAAGTAGARFDGSPSCDAGDWDRFWCPTGRQNLQSVGPDYVGIYMEANVSWLIGVLPGGGRTIRDTVVMRIEPTG